MRDFNGKVVVITGGATGIGYGFAKAFGREGARLVLSGLQEDRLEQAVAGLTDLGVKARYFVADVSHLDEMEELADYAWKAFGRVDVIVNNAGIMLPNTPAVDVPLDSVHRIFDVNFFGVWHGSAVFARRFIKQGTPAAIYNVGSENSLFHGVPMGSAYVATKHAVRALTESLREEMPAHIDVGLICPGFVRSELGPPKAMALAMNTDRFVGIALEQIKAGEFYIVSHAYNMERITASYNEVAEAFATYAPRYEGDQEFDVRTLMSSMQVAADITN